MLEENITYIHTPNDPRRPWRLLGKRCIKGIYDWDDWDCTTVRLGLGEKERVERKNAFLVGGEGEREGGRGELWVGDVGAVVKAQRLC